MIIIQDVSMAFGGRVLFTNVNVNLNPGKKYALLGANGVGKSTFMKILAGIEVPSEGTLTSPKGTRIGWMRQDQYLNDEDRIVDAVIQGNQRLWQAMQSKQILLEADDWNDESVNRIAELEDVIASEGGYEAESFASILLSGLGIAQERHEMPLSTLSGGFKLRVLLAQTLFNNPDVLLLDEPTNHLDIGTIAWLEDYLSNQYNGTLLVISHDHDFLNRLCTNMLDIDYGEIREYHGNYDYFVKKKQEVITQKEHQLAHMQEHVARMRKFIERFRASASRSKQALSREKLLDRMELPDIEKSSRRAPTFDFQFTTKSSKQLLKVSKIDKSFGENQVLFSVGFQLERQDKIALVGPNGIGKSTLLKVLMGLLRPDSGAVKWGESVKISYFAQDHKEVLTSQQTAIEYIMENVNGLPDMSYYGALGRALFDQDQMHSGIKTLSGGEAARLLFAKMMLEKSNILVLDEPTNHLDLESREALSKSLDSYEGSIICVSHDRHFVGNFANRIIAMTPEGVTDYKGTYIEFLDKFGHDYLNRNWVLKTG